MRFTKIKSGDKGVHLEWTTPAEGHDETLIEHRLSSEDAPTKEFTAALQAFRSEVGDLLELPEAWTEGLKVIGLSINYEEDGRLGLVVTCLKPLDRTNAPLVLNTPHLREASDEDTGNYLPDEMLDLIKAAETQAGAYVKGQRAQTDLFAKAAQDFVDGIPEGHSVTVSTEGSEPVTVHGRGKSKHR